MAPDPDLPPPPYHTDYDPNAKIDGLPATVTIVDIYPAIMREKPHALRAASQGWSLLGTTMWGSSQDMQTEGDKLRSGWRSDAAEYFFPYIDRTRQSLGEWEQICYTNAQALSALSDTLDELQPLMQSIWEAFKAEQKQNYTDENGGGIGELFTDIGEWRSDGTRINSTLQKFTEQTQNEVLTPFTNAFSAAWSALSDAPSFRGPTDAEKPAAGYEQRLTRALAPTLPGGMPVTPGGLSSPPAPPADPRGQLPPVPPPAPLLPVPPVPSSEQPGAPVAPPLPIAPIAPVAPVAPIAPHLPAELRTPPAPPEPPPALAPNRLTPPAPPAFAVNSGAFPQPPAIPGNGEFPAAPNTPRSDVFERGATPVMPGEIPAVGGGPGSPDGPGSSRLGLPASLQGRGGGPGSALPGGEPEMPQLPGRGGPGVPPPGRSMPPGLPGRNRPQRGRPAESGPRQNGNVEFPGAENTSSLLGRNRPPFGGPSRSLGSPLTPAEPDVPRGLEGMRGKTPPRGTTETSPRSRTGLDGRLRTSEFDVPETLENAQAALRPGLGGRGTGVTEPEYLRPTPSSRGSRPEPKDDTAAKAPVYVGIDERFEVEISAPAVIERPADRSAVTRPGPTLSAPAKEKTDPAST